MAGSSSILTLILLLVFVGFYIFCWWKIFSKAGYHGAWGIAMVIPLVSVIGIAFLAFSDWPSRRDKIGTTFD